MHLCSTAFHFPIAISDFFGRTSATTSLAPHARPQPRGLRSELPADSRSRRRVREFRFRRSATVHGHVCLSSILPVAPGMPNGEMEAADSAKTVASLARLEALASVEKIGEVVPFNSAEASLGPLNDGIRLAYSSVLIRQTRVRRHRRSLRKSSRRPHKESSSEDRRLHVLRRGDERDRAGA